MDSLAVARLLAWRLAENRRGELVRGLLGRAIGAPAANTLMGPLPPGTPAIVQGAARVEPPTTDRPSEPPAGPLARLESPPMPPGLEWLDVTARAGGSNSWVVAGSRTATGRPLLANDPHLNVEMPSIWYEAHLVAAGLDVAGVTLPGTPFVIIGHNKRIAWGLTNTGADVVDFYVEDVDMSTRRYLYRGAWQPLTVKQVHDRRARRSGPNPTRCSRPIHGPLVATETAWEDPPDFAGATGRLNPKPLALRWEAVRQGETAGAFDALESRRTLDRVPRGGPSLRRAFPEPRLRRRRRPYRLRDVRAGSRFEAAATAALQCQDGPERPNGRASFRRISCRPCSIRRQGRSSPPTPKSIAPGHGR